MASMVICHCCGMGEDHHDKAMGASSWPPQMPPVVEDSQGHTFIRGYLKRLNSQKPGAESEEKWVVRWIELERPLDRPGSSELLLSVYKSDAKLKRLNAVIFRRIKASVLSTVRAARVYNVSSRKVGGSRVPHMLSSPSTLAARARDLSRVSSSRAVRAAVGGLRFGRPTRYLHPRPEHRIQADGARPSRHRDVGDDAEAAARTREQSRTGGIAVTWQAQRGGRVCVLGRGQPGFSCSRGGRGVLHDPDPPTGPGPDYSM